MESIILILLVLVVVLIVLGMAVTNARYERERKLREAVNRYTVALAAMAAPINELGPAVAEAARQITAFFDTLEALGAWAERGRR